jgi:hypothetical protein
MARHLAGITGDGKTSLAPASRHGAPAGGNPYPPAGNYHFFDESRAAGEKIVPADMFDEAQRLLKEYRAGAGAGAK